MKTPLLCALIGLCVVVAAFVDGTAFETCKTVKAVSYEECLAAHGIK